MIRVAIHYTSIGTDQNQWDYILSHFSVDEVYVYGSGAEHPNYSNIFKAAIIVETADGIPSTGKLVVMSPQNARYIPGDENLIDFVHPIGEDVTYFFGPSNINLSEDDLASRTPDHKVYIPTVTQDQMYPWIACAITLYDRLVKTGG